MELHSDYALTVRDNGRGILIDPYPKFPDKSALESILCTLHAGGKFSGSAYQTFGGLHKIGASVVIIAPLKITFVRILPRVRIFSLLFH